MTGTSTHSKAAFWKEHEGTLRALYDGEWERLADVNRASIEWLRAAFGIETPLRWASELDAEDDPTQRLIDLCRAVGADVYLGGADGRNYMDVERFAEARIEVIFQEYQHPSYDQLFDPFESHLSALDLVLNCGPRSLEILRQGRRDVPSRNDT